MHAMRQKTSIHRWTVFKKKEKHLKKRKARAQELKIKSGFEIKKGPSSRNFRHSD